MFQAAEIKMHEAPWGCPGVRAQLAGERPGSEDREQEAFPLGPTPRFGLRMCMCSRLPGVVPRTPCDGDTAEAE